MFQHVVYQYAVDDWENKKRCLQPLIDHSKSKDTRVIIGFDMKLDSD